jgi:hypothetical protein
LVLFANWIQLSNNPSSNTKITKEEFEEIKNSLNNNKSEKPNNNPNYIPWARFFKEPSLYAVIIAHFCSNFSW